MTERHAARAAFLLTLSVVLGLPAIVTAEFVPAEYRSGTLPAIPIAAVSGGEVFLDVHVDAAGRVADVRVLRATPPFTEEVVAAVRGWQFLPAEDDLAGDAGGVRRRIPVDAHVFVAAVYRPPTLNGPTLGDPPKDLANPSEALPAALAWPMPVYPADAIFDGVVLAEAQVGADGRIDRARLIRSTPVFSQAALDALRAWTFRPARVAGRPVASRVYVVFAFRQPVTSGR